MNYFLKIYLIYIYFKYGLGKQFFKRSHLTSPDGVDATRRFNLPSTTRDGRYLSYRQYTGSETSYRGDIVSSQKISL